MNQNKSIHNCGSTTERRYTSFKEKSKQYITNIIPYIRRIIRFIALPYTFYEVNWNECKVSKVKVAIDFLYIFFVLKDYPDYYTKFRLWEKSRHEWKYYYGSNYNPYQKHKLKKDLQKKEYEIVFTDKYLCNLLCKYHKLPIPKLIDTLNPAERYKNKLKNAIIENRKIIIKPIRGQGGNQVHLAQLMDNEIYIYNGVKQYNLEEFELLLPSIMQSYVDQHIELSKISRSTNTIRTETMFTKNNGIIILGAFMRFGVNDHFLDNQTVGGISIGININSGELFSYAMNKHGEKFYKHPDTHFHFDKFQVPYWNEVIELSKELQKKFHFYGLLGPDIAISPEGPVLVEINANPDHAGLEMDYGPIFKNKDVWSAFKEHNLLINKSSLNLY